MNVSELYYCWTVNSIDLLLMPSLLVVEVVFVMFTTSGCFISCHVTMALS